MFRVNFENTADSSLSLLEASLWPSKNTIGHRLSAVGVLDLHRTKYQSMRPSPLCGWLISSFFTLV